MTVSDPEVEERGLLATSIVIAQKTGRPLQLLPQTAAISVVTLAELHLGGLIADDPAVRAQRLRTLSSVDTLFEPLAIDAEVARTLAEPRRQGRRPKIIDTWIAATAVARTLPAYTQDDDFMAIPRVRVVLV